MSLGTYIICIVLIILAINYKISWRDNKGIATEACRVEGRKLDFVKPGLFTIEYSCGRKLFKDEIEVKQP